MSEKIDKFCLSAAILESVWLAKLFGMYASKQNRRCDV